MTAAQLRGLGLGPRGIQHRVRSGRLHVVHRTVYAVGHDVLTVDGRRLAAVLACGPGAVLSHQSAAAMWGMLAGDGLGWHVTVPGRSGGRQGPRAVVVHHPRRLGAADVTARRGIPATTVARVVVDLADVLPPDRYEAAVHEAQVLRLLDVDAVARALDRAPGRRGRRRVLAVLGAFTASAPTRSELERRFLVLCRDHGLPAPAVNARVEARAGWWPEVDALFADARLIVELDGAAVHHTRRAFERDRARDAALAARGYVVIRITWRRLADEPAAVAAELRQVLRVRGRRAA